MPLIHIVPADDLKAAEHQQELVELLEDLLAEAKAGELVEVVLMGKMADGSNRVSASYILNRYELAGRLEKMKMDALEDD